MPRESPGQIESVTSSTRWGSDAPAAENVHTMRQSPSHAGGIGASRARAGVAPASRRPAKAITPRDTPGDPRPEPLLYSMVRSAARTGDPGSGRDRVPDLDRLVAPGRSSQGALASRSVLTTRRAPQFVRAVPGRWTGRTEGAGTLTEPNLFRLWIRDSPLCRVPELPHRTHLVFSPDTALLLVALALLCLLLAPCLGAESAARFRQPGSGTPHSLAPHATLVRCTASRVGDRPGGKLERGCIFMRQGPPFRRTAAASRR